MPGRGTASTAGAGTVTMRTDRHTWACGVSPCFAIAGRMRYVPRGFGVHNLVTEATSQTRRLPPLSVRWTGADTYRYLWQHRWTFFWHLFIWAILMWIARIPAQLLTVFAGFAGLAVTISGQDITDYAIDLIVSILCLLAGGGLMFLSCGRAIIFGRMPRIGDAVRPFRMGTFWR